MNNNRDQKVISKGIGFTGLLTLAFIVLKLVGVITWKWIWVISPLWISVALTFLVVGIILIVLACSDRKKNKKN